MIDQVCLTEAVLDAAKEVFQTMIFMEIEPMAEADCPMTRDTFYGSITFKGDIEGCLGICCEIPCIQAIAAGMLAMDNGQELSEQELVDAIGEVANMVMGSVKTRLQDTIASIEVSIPSVIYGRVLKSSIGEGATKVLHRLKVGGTQNMELSLLCRSRDRAS